MLRPYESEEVILDRTSAACRLRWQRESSGRVQRFTSSVRVANIRISTGRVGYYYYFAATFQKPAATFACDRYRGDDYR